MSSITIKTQSKATCCKGKKIYKRVSRVHVSNNDIVGPGYLSTHKIKEEYFCDECGAVYLPTKNNQLNLFNTSHIPVLLESTRGVLYDKQKFGHLFDYLTDGKWIEKVENIFVNGIFNDGALRVVNRSEFDGFQGHSFFETEAKRYWLKDKKEVIFWSKYKLVPKEEGDLQKFPTYPEVGIALRDRHQEILAKIDEESFKKGTATKRVENETPLPDDAVGFCSIYGPWDDYREPISVPECFV